MSIFEPNVQVTKDSSGSEGSQSESDLYNYENVSRRQIKEIAHNIHHFFYFLFRI